VKRKTKRLEAWALDTTDHYWVYPFQQDADDKLHDRKEGGEFDVGRVVRLVECGPDEVVMSKRAAAVVRAAVAYWGACEDKWPAQPEWFRLVRAVERMQAKRPPVECSCRRPAVHGTLPRHGCSRCDGTGYLKSKKGGGK
jgi:hypothetical protein